MEHKKTVEVPATTREVTVKVTCDVCHATIKSDGWGDVDRVEVDRVEVKHEEGQSWPEGTHIKSRAFDLCSKCFDEKLVPWMKAQGADPRDEEVDF